MSVLGKVKVWSCALGLLCVSPGMAQNVSPSALALDVVESRVVQRALDDYLSARSMLAEFALLGQKRPKDELVDLFEIAEEEIAALRPGIDALLALYMAQTFTAEELQAIKDFILSDPGSSALPKMRAFSLGFRQGLVPVLSVLEKRIAARMAEKDL